MKGKEGDKAVLLTVGGSDGSGGAGVQADLRAFQSCGAEGLSVMSAIVIEDTREVQEIHPLSAGLVERQLRFLLERYEVAAMKTGLLPSKDHVAAVARVLRDYREIPLVIDPVLRATAGNFQLAGNDVIGSYREELIPLASLICPNRDEGEALLAKRQSLETQDLETEGLEKEALALALSEELEVNVFLKGGHYAIEGGQCVDYLASEKQELTLFKQERLAGESPHGTGCVLSAMAAAEIGKGLELIAALKAARSSFQEAYGQVTRVGAQRPTLLRN